MLLFPLLGYFAHTMDERGRVSLPSIFRDALWPNGEIGRMVICPSPLLDCLRLYPLEVWNELVAPTFHRMEADTVSMDFRRALFSNSVVAEVDRVGRVIIPANLRDLVALSDDVVFCGQQNYVECWSKARWESEGQGLVKELAVLMRKVGLGGRAT